MARAVAFAWGVGLIARLNKHMRREDPFREPNPELGLSIRLFGGMAIHDSRGADYLPRSRKTRALVAILALSAPRPTPRIKLTSLLWSQRENEQARASLRQAVHELQETLGSGWNRILAAERHTLSIDVRGVTVDALAAISPAAPSLALLALFQEGFLEDLHGLDPAFDDWLEQERRRLLAIARMTGETFLDERHPGAEIIVAARSLLRVDPTHDGAWRALIQANIDAGDRAAARFARQRWREAIGLEPGQPPPPEMAMFLAGIRFETEHHTAGLASAPIRARALPKKDMPDWVTPDWASPGTAIRKGVAQERIVPDTILPAEVPPDWVLPQGAAPREAIPPQALAEVPAPGLMLAWGEGVEEGRMGVGTGAESRRSTLRLGIREMRVIGPNVDQALSPGLAEEITTALSRFRWISCVSGSSLAAIAGETGETNLRWSDVDLDLILDGTIQRGGEHVRVTVRLLDMRSGGTVIWANRFDHDASDTLSVQDRVAAAIVAQVDPVLLIREGEWAASRNRNGVSPRDLVLQAVPAIYRMDRISFHAAGNLLEAALRVEPTNTDALAWFAYWHLFLIGQGWADDPEAATSRAGQLADAAVAMDPNDARALTLAGHVRGFLMKRASEATVLHERAISLNPNLAIAWCFSGFALSYLGDHEAALQRMRQAISLSPSDPHLFFFQAAMIMPHLLRGEFHEAAAVGRQAIELNSWFSSSFKGHLAALGHLGCAAEAAAVMSRLLKLEAGFTVRDAIRRSPMSLPEDVDRYAEGLRRAGLPEG